MAFSLLKTGQLSAMQPEETGQHQADTSCHSYPSLWPWGQVNWPTLLSLPFGRHCGRSPFQSEPLVYCSAGSPRKRCVHSRYSSDSCYSTSTCNCYPPHPHPLEEKGICFHSSWLFSYQASKGVRIINHSIHFSYQHSFLSPFLNLFLSLCYLFSKPQKNYL